MTRRMKRFYFVGALLAALLIVNVLFFLIVLNPARSEHSRLQTAIQELQLSKMQRAATVDSLVQTADALESFGKDREEFQSGHLVKRKNGFATVLRTLNDLVENSGVKKTRVEYSAPTAIPAYGLHEVKITIPVQGDYASVFKFIKELQTAPIVFIITAVDVRGAATSSDDVDEDAATISLTLAMETYFYDERS